MRVALLITDLEPGGAPLRIARLARGLREAGVDVHVGCLAGPGAVSAALDRDGIATFACGARSARDFPALLRLKEHLRRLQPDLLHSTLAHANVAARLVGGILDIPVCGSTATVEVERQSHLRLERATAWLDRAHIVHSRALAEHVQRAFRIAPARVHVIPPVIDAPPDEALQRETGRAWLGVSEREFVIVWAGRFDPVKRLDIVVDVAEILSDLPVRCFLAGDGPERARIERRLRAGSAANRVTLLGWQPDLTPLFAGADIMLFPSLTEGMPNALLEAMACGVCVVASDIPVLRELAGDPERIVLTQSDRAAGFAETLRTLWQDRARRTAAGRAARAWALARLSTRTSVTALLEVYRKVLGLRPPRQLARDEPGPVPDQARAWKRFEGC